MRSPEIGDGRNATRADMKAMCDFVSAVAPEVEINDLL
jgi:hypothetical protein